jgi:hypothetical protein
MGLTELKNRVWNVAQTKRDPTGVGGAAIELLANRGVDL